MKPHRHDAIGADVAESFKVWASLETKRIAKKYVLIERDAVNAVSMTVLGATVGTLRALGKTINYIVSIIRGEPS
jgi:hypothetical protein